MGPFADLTGHWIGHYLQGGRECPIAADFVQVGKRLTGSMTDGQPERERSVFEAACEAGLPPGSDETIEQQLRASFPDAPAGPIRHVTTLPPHSVLDGSRNGDAIAFLKSYQGVHSSGFKVGDYLVGVQTDRHAVRYDGRLSADGMTIEGRWWIAADPLRGIGHAEGLFHLRRSTSTHESRHEETAPAPTPDVRPW